MTIYNSIVYSISNLNFDNMDIDQRANIADSLGNIAKDLQEYEIDARLINYLSLGYLKLLDFAKFDDKSWENDLSHDSLLRIEQSYFKVLA